MKVPRSLDLWLNNRIPDHVLDNRSSAGRGDGSMKGVLFGTNSDREKHGEYLAHFFKEIDKGVHAVVNNKTVPLVLAAVESEIAIYRRVNIYPNLMPHAVHGSTEERVAPARGSGSAEDVSRAAHKGIDRTRELSRHSSGIVQPKSDSEASIRRLSIPFVASPGWGAMGRLE